MLAIFLRAPSPLIALSLFLCVQKKKEKKRKERTAWKTSSARQNESTTPLQMQKHFMFIIACFINLLVISFFRAGRLFTLCTNTEWLGNNIATTFTWTLLTSPPAFSSEIPLCRGRPFARGYNRDITHYMQAYNIKSKIDFWVKRRKL